MLHWRGPVLHWRGHVCHWRGPMIHWRGRVCRAHRHLILACSTSASSCDLSDGQIHLATCSKNGLTAFP